MGLCACVVVVVVCGSAPCFCSKLWLIRPSRACATHSTQYDDAGIEQLRLPTTDGFCPSKRDMLAGCAFIKEAIKHDPNAKVFIHCRYVLLPAACLLPQTAARLRHFTHAATPSCTVPGSAWGGAHPWLWWRWLLPVGTPKRHSIEPRRCAQKLLARCCATQTCAELLSTSLPRVRRARRRSSQAFHATACVTLPDMWYTRIAAAPAHAYA